MAISEKKPIRNSYQVIRVPAGISINDSRYGSLTFTTRKGISISEYVPAGYFSSLTSTQSLPVYINGTNISSSNTFRTNFQSTNASKIEVDIQDQIYWNYQQAPGNLTPSTPHSLVYAENKTWVYGGTDSNSSLQRSYSTDGITWTQSGTGASGGVQMHLQYAGDKYFQLRTQNFYSTDGITWTSFTPAVNGTTNAIAYHAGTYVIKNSTTAVSTSTNGINWTTRGLIAASGYGANTAASLSSATYPMLFAGQSLNGTSNGITWTSMPTPTGQAINQIISDGSQYLLVSDAGNLATSSNGSTWTIRTTYVPAGGSAWRTIAYGNSPSGYKYMIGGYNGSLNVSTDSITWTTRVIWVTAGLQSYETSAYGQGKFINIGYRSGNGFNYYTLVWTTSTFAYSQSGVDIHLWIPDSTTTI